MDNDTAIYVGLDVHKETVAISEAETGRSPARYVGTFTHDVPKLIKALNKLVAPEQLHVAYEAGLRRIDEVLVTNPRITLPG